MPTPLLVAELGGSMADGGRFAESEGELVPERGPFKEVIDVWIFSGLFNLLILQIDGLQLTSAPSAT